MPSRVAPIVMTAEVTAILVLAVGAIILVIIGALIWSRRSRALLNQWASNHGYTITGVRQPLISLTFVFKGSTGFDAEFHVRVVDTHGRKKEGKVLFQHVFWRYSDERVKVIWNTV